MSTNIERTEIDLDYISYKKAAVAASGPDAKPLPKMTVDGSVIEFMPGDTIMQALERVTRASDIPRFCYHPGMPIAGTCRMCTVEVEKAPKLMTSCSTPATDGMVVHTKSEKVLKSRNGVMDFLLTNHPLDCPVCDKAGECDLQNYNFEYGPDSSNFKEGKRVFKEATTKPLSDKITLNMNRCVHCERCVRFTESVTETHDLVMLNRGWHKELAATDEEKGLTNDYQGCLTDFCPVGALTLNDFRFQKRVWFLDKNASICDGCSKGCNIETHSEKNVVYRVMPIFNEKVNGHWMCDEGRVSYHTYADANRIIAPQLKSIGSSNALASATWDTSISFVKNKISSSQNILLIIGTDATSEEASILMNEIPKLSSGKVIVKFHNGTGNVTTSADNKALDKLLRQSDKTPNTKGLEALKISALTPQDFSSKDLIIFARHGRAALPKMEGADVILWGVFNRNDLENTQSKIVALLPGLATYEKSGSYTNCDGITQSFTNAVDTLGQGISVEGVINALKGNK